MFSLILFFFHCDKIVINILTYIFVYITLYFDRNYFIFNDVTWGDNNFRTLLTLPKNIKHILEI